MVNEHTRKLTGVVAILDAIETLSIDSENYGEIYELLKGVKTRIYEVRNQLKEEE
jgi:hypothetical protein